MTTVLICTIISSTSASGYGAIPATQLVWNLIDLMKSAGWDTRVNVKAKAVPSAAAHAARGLPLTERNLLEKLKIEDTSVSSCAMFDSGRENC